MRYSHSHKRDRSSHSHCYRHDQRHGYGDILPFLQSFNCRLTFIFFSSPPLQGGNWRVSRPITGSLTLTFFAFAFIALLYFDWSNEGEPRTVERVRERRCVIRIRTNETDARIRIVTATTNDTATIRNIIIAIGVPLIEI